MDNYLRVAEVPDYPQAFNGLQVENPGSVSRILAAVDACQSSIDAAVVVGADLVLVHHGLFWGGLEPITGRNWKRLGELIRKDIALYSSHLPLDCHEEVGNSALLAKQLGVSQTGRFAQYEGTAIGVMGELNLELNELSERLEELLGTSPTVIATGPRQVKRVGVVTGGGGPSIGEAAAAGLDTLITGEGSHHTYFDAEELGINVIYAGHYATETFGVKALAARVADKFGLEWEFFDHPTGL